MDMQFKKFALRGMIILAVVIALCVLFSGTLRTLTTAKVRFVKTSMGKIEQTMELEGKVVFPDHEEMKLRVPEGLSLTVARVHVVNGEKVTAGAPLLSLEVTDEESKLAELQKDVDEARSELEEWERKNSDIRLSRNEQLWIDAYNAAREAESAELEVRLALMAELGVSKTSKLTEKTVSKGSDTAKELYGQWLNAVKEMETAQQKQVSLNRYAVDDELWKTLQSKQTSQKKQKDAEDKMIKIRLLEKQVGLITAPRDGYVIEVKVEKGSTLTGESDLLLFTPEGVEPVIRAEIKDAEKPVQKGGDIYIVVDAEKGKRIKTKVKATGVTETGVQCADAEITSDVLYEFGSVSKMMKNESSFRMQVISKAKQNSCLISTSAVKSDENGYYVLVAESDRNALGETVLRLSKYQVHVVGENEGLTAVEEEYLHSGGYKIAYMEDRPIKAGDIVIESKGAKRE